jgi:FtsZ-binding cell division protein ZapB
MKKEQDVDNFDFGFSFVDEDYEEVKEVNTKLTQDVSTSQVKVGDLETRLEQLYNAIVPFLDNLCKNPEKSTILWPNRVEKIQAYKRKLEAIAKV